MNSPKFEIKPKVKPGRYRHYKGGLYQVDCVGLDSETHRQSVVYRSLDHGTVWIRDEEMFMENVTVDGKEIPRFTFLE